MLIYSKLSYYVYSSKSLFETGFKLSPALKLTFGTVSSAMYISKYHACLNLKKLAIIFLGNIRIYYY